MQIAAVGGAVHIAIKSKKGYWWLLAVCAVLIFVRRLLGYTESATIYTEGTSLGISLSFLLGMVLVHRGFDRTTDWLKTLAECVPHMVVVMDKDGRADYVNTAWLDYTGITREAHRRLAWHSLLHPDDALEVIASWSRALMEGVPYIREVRIRNKAGEYRWHLIKCFLLKNVKGELARWYATCTDVHHLRMDRVAFEDTVRLKLKGSGA